MKEPTILALTLAAGLFLLGFVTAWWQLKARRELAERKHVPSDEQTYLRGKHRRRLITGVLLMAIGGLIAGAYLSGLEGRADALAEPNAAALAQPDPERPEAKREMTDQERQFVRFWGLYWIGVIILVFTLVGLAGVDALATRRYWMEQLRHLRDEHQNQLRRDLAVFKQHQEQTRGGRLANRLPNPDDTPPPDSDD